MIRGGADIYVRRWKRTLPRRPQADRLSSALCRYDINAVGEADQRPRDARELFEPGGDRYQQTIFAVHVFAVLGEQTETAESLGNKFARSDLFFENGPHGGERPVTHAKTARVAVIVPAHITRAQAARMCHLNFGETAARKHSADFRDGRFGVRFGKVLEHGI